MRIGEVTGNERESAAVPARVVRTVMKPWPDGRRLARSAELHQAVIFSNVKTWNALQWMIGLPQQAGHRRGGDRRYVERGDLEPGNAKRCRFHRQAIADAKNRPRTTMSEERQQLRVRGHHVGERLMHRPDAKVRLPVTRPIHAHHERRSADSSRLTCWPPATALPAVEPGLPSRRPGVSCPTARARRFSRCRDAPNHRRTQSNAMFTAVDLWLVTRFVAHRRHRPASPRDSPFQCLGMRTSRGPSAGLP